MKPLLFTDRDFALHSFNVQFSATGFVYVNVFFHVIDINTPGAVGHGYIAVDILNGHAPRPVFYLHISCNKFGVNASGTIVYKYIPLDILDINTPGAVIDTYFTNYIFNFNASGVIIIFQSAL